MSKQAANPYRSILRRHLPEPLLALLIFVMGVWLWDNHFGDKFGYEAGVGRMALRKTDRDLRLADSAGHWPAPLRRLLAIPDRGTALENGVRALRLLEADRSLDNDGAYALAVLSTLHSGKENITVIPADPQAVVRRVAQGTDVWWDREYLAKLAARGGGTVSPSVGGSDPRSREVLLRTVLARGAVWLLACCSLAFVPEVMRTYFRALRGRGRGYIARWPTALGLGVFLLAYLASIGFGLALEVLISGASRGDGEAAVAIPPGLFAVLDAATRFLPALLALAFLFRRGRHAWHRLGLGATPEWKLVLGSFGLLAVADQALKLWLGLGPAGDPAGGLSEMEAGPWGLVFAITSACIAAPVAEEILYRGVLFRSLANGIRVPAATLLSAAVFASVHYYDAYGLLSVGLLGAACALCFAASGRLATAIFLHALYNFAIKVPEWIVYHAPL